MLKTIIETMQGVRGTVNDKYGKPIRTAVVTINRFADVYHVSPNAAVFKANLPIGSYIINVS